jgi:hydrogenase 3 maturation protease
MHLSPRPALKKALGPETPSAARPVVVLGVGSPLRSDDAAGLHVAAALAHAPLPHVTVIDAGPAPENFTSEIRRLRPAVLLIVDCAQMGEAPGCIRMITPDEISGVSFGTHGLPLSVLAGYVSREVGCSVIFLGIEPSSLEPGEVLSPSAKAGVAEAVAVLREILSPPLFFS